MESIEPVQVRTAGKINRPLERILATCVRHDLYGTKAAIRSDVALQAVNA